MFMYTVHFVIWTEKLISILCLYMRCLRKEKIIEHTLGENVLFPHYYLNLELILQENLCEMIEFLLFSVSSILPSLWKYL